jgi:type I restriction enzyme S subunit
MNRTTKWAEVRVGDVGQIITGRTPSTKCPEYFGNDFFFITPRDMHQEKHVRFVERSLSKAGANLLRRIQLPPKSICVSCIGSQMGEVVMTSVISFTNQQINSIVPNRDVDADFLYYSFLPRKQELLSLGSALGAATPILNKSSFSDIRMMLPPLATQRKIATILSAYDDLIENNLRRIKILEEMAQELYREWFVKFHFTGHEHTRFTDSPVGLIPDGWGVKRILEFGNVVTGKTPSKANPDFYGDEVPFVKTPDMHGNMFILGVGNWLSVAGAQSQANKTIPSGSICVSCIGTIGVVSITTEDCQTNQQINSVVLKNEQVREFLFFRLKGAKQALKNLGASGATMGNVNKGKFESLEMITPSDNLVYRYHEFAAPLFSEMLVLSRKNTVLRRTRDLLLPKLISGEVNVSELDIAIAEGG